MPQQQAGKILKQAGDAELSFYADHRDRRLFAVPVARGNQEQAGLLAGEFQGLLYVIRYGYIEPRWIFQGERAVARAEVLTGKSLPFLHEGMVAWTVDLKFGTLDELATPEARKQESYSKQAFFYVCTFRAGPSKYRRAYKAFLKDFGTTYDHEGAVQRHLAPLDARKLEAAVIELVHFRLKAIKPK